MRSLIRAGQLLGLGTATMSMIVLGAAPAWAAPPANDTSATATAVTAFPFSDVVDTTEATTDAEDAALNANCGAPATNGSVWYAITAGDSPAYVATVLESDFLAGVIVATGTPGNLSILTCGPDSVGFEAVTGETYYVMAFSDNPAVPGGQLSIQIVESGPAPKVSMTVDDVGKVNRKTGLATISGTYTCIGEADLLVVQGRLQQEQGDAQIGGNFEALNLTCGGTNKWSVEVTPESGKFKRGLAATVALTGACNALGCNVYETLEVVNLRNSGH